MPLLILLLLLHLLLDYEKKCHHSSCRQKDPDAHIKVLVLMLAKRFQHCIKHRVGFNWKKVIRCHNKAITMIVTLYSTRIWLKHHFLCTTSACFLCTFSDNVT